MGPITWGALAHIKAGFRVKARRHTITWGALAQALGWFWKAENWVPTLLQEVSVTVRKSNM